MNNLVEIKDLKISYSNKICFENFSSAIEYNSKIAIIGRNGSGKTSIIKMLAKKIQPSQGKIFYSSNSSIEYIPQDNQNIQNLSGGENLIKLLLTSIRKNPNILLLDEPTNHLDKDNKKYLFHILNKYKGALIFASHDQELCSKFSKSIWHIQNQKVTIFNSNYNEYIKNTEIYKESINKKLNEIKKSKKELHNSLMEQQKRSSTSKKIGQKNIKNNKYPTITSLAKANRSQENSGKKIQILSSERWKLLKRYNEIEKFVEIKPKFYFSNQTIKNKKHIISISDGSFRYIDSNIILKDINIHLEANQKIVITGKNASGKTGLIKSIMNSNDIIKYGEWKAPKMSKIGYLDQFYSNLPINYTVFNYISIARNFSNDADIRKHLSNFLFRTEQEINNKISNLSLGEKARLSLSYISASIPHLLILDEVTNNLDLYSKENILNVLKSYPGSMILISHDEEFINNCKIDKIFEIRDFNISYKI